MNHSQQQYQHPQARGFQMPPEPDSISSTRNFNLDPDQPKAMGAQHPMVKMTPRMVTSIKNSPKGKIPAGLARYLAAKRAAKGGK